MRRSVNTKTWSVVLLFGSCLFQIAHAQDTTKSVQQGPVQLEEILGSWTTSKGDEIEIVAEKGAIAFHGKHDWPVGRYNPTTATLAFEASPHIRDMNPGLPLWVREKVQGQLRIRMELKARRDPGEKGGMILVGNWYPGEVRWETTVNDATNEVMRNIISVGEGGSITLELTRPGVRVAQGGRWPEDGP